MFSVTFNDILTDVPLNMPEYLLIESGGSTIDWPTRKLRFKPGDVAFLSGYFYITLHVSTYN